MWHFLPLYTLMITTSDWQITSLVGYPEDSWTDVQCVDALGFTLTFTRPILWVDTIWAHCLPSFSNTSQMCYGFKYPFSQVCNTRSVCVRLHYLGFVSHGSFAQHRDLGSGLLLQTLDCIALRSQNLPHEIELIAKQSKTKLAWQSKPRRV